MGLVPLLVFAVLDSFVSFKAGLIGALLSLVAEAALSVYWLGEIDDLSLFNLVLVCVFALLAWKYNKPEYFKLQPSFLSLVFGALLLGSYAVDRPILKEFFLKYRIPVREMLRDNPQALAMIDSEIFLALMSETCFTFGVLLFAHAGLTAYTAYRKSNTAWFAARLSWYGFMFAAMFWARFRVFG